jgi:ABC-type nitrate/sulfonate/bicarbonate transport system substrate-binding protein
VPAWAAALAALAIAFLGATASRAQDKPHLRVSSLTLPVFNPIVWNIMKQRGFDAKNGFELEIKPYPSISAFYAAFATGETDVLVGGPTILQKLYLEGVPVRIIATGLTLSDLVVFVRDPAITSIVDLKGKQIAADMGGSQYQMVAIYAAAKGLKLGQDITVVNGNFAVSRAQLEAGRVEAAVIAEPMATSIMMQNPDWKVIFNGAAGWKELTGQDGWEIVAAMRADTIQRVPGAPKMMVAALQDVASFIRTETEAADKLANETVKLPAGVLKSAVAGKRWDFDVRPAWGPDRKAIWDMMERAVKAGFYAKMPDEKIIYVP